MKVFSSIGQFVENIEVMTKLGAKMAAGVAIVVVFLYMADKTLDKNITPSEKGRDHRRDLFTCPITGRDLCT